MKRLSKIYGETMVETKKYVERLVQTGMEKAKATDKIKRIIAKIKEKKGDDVTDDEIDRLISQALVALASHTGERYKGVCIAFARKMDRNQRYAEQALKFYNDKVTKPRVVVTEKNPKGYEYDGETYGVKEEMALSGEIKIVPLDMRKFIDKNKKFENKYYGKALRASNTRRCYFIVEGVLSMVNGNIDPQIGCEYYIYGKKNGAFINVGKQGIQKAGAVDKTPLYEMVSNFAAESDFAVPLEDIQTLKPYEIRLTTGFIKGVGDTRTGGKWVSIQGDTYPQGLFCFSGNDDVTAILSGVFTGNEVFAVVQAGKPREGQEGISANILGLVVNPASGENADLLGDIDALIVEE